MIFMEGLKVGIEIHQRLDSHSKLFCNCSTRMAQEESGIIKRKLKAVAGELGNVDPAALHELMRGREFFYHRYGSCLVEQDDEPPHQLNREAFAISLQVAKLLGAHVPEEIHIMRKTVIDGSNTSGFQRTAIIAMDGSIETSEGSVAIPTIGLEEEAAQILSRESGKVEYGLDRLGIPLIEIATSVMKSGKQAKEAALKLGALLRSVKVQRGLGTIRQDVNISIPGGSRVEVKGFQDVDFIETLISLEVERQRSLLAIRDELKKTVFKTENIIDVTHVFQSTKNRKISSMINEGKKIWAMKLEGFEGLLKRKISGERTLGRELSGYAKAYGSGIMHSDEDVKKYEIEGEFDALRKELKSAQRDLVMIAIGERKAIEAVSERVKRLFEGVPEETRESNEDYTTSYSRPLPGKSRLYPETDVPPAKLFDVALPETLDQKKQRYMKIGLNSQLCEELFRSPFSHLFEDFQKNPVRTATLLTATLKELKRDGNKMDNISEANLRELLVEMEKTEIPKEKVSDILIGFTEGRGMPKLEGADIDEVVKAIDDEIAKNKSLVEKEGEQAFQKLMGPVMARLRGRVPGAIISEELKKRLKK